MSIFQTGKMIYRNFGASGLKVSAISLGNMINYKEENYQEDENIIKLALQNGINHFDTAQIYAAGQAQATLGKILKNLKVPREQIVIATKILTANDPDINSQLSLNRKHIKQSINKSLQRLQMEYVDILYAHFYDQQTPLEEVCRGFHEVIEQGKVFYWATSNWDSQSVFNALAICERLNLHKPIGGQNQYSMLVRKIVQFDYQSLFEKYNYGLIAWSPLAGGFLTGKHLDKIKSQEQQVNRLNDSKGPFPKEILKNLFYDQHNTEKNIKALRQLQVLAKTELECSLIHLALAWAVKFKHIDSALIGARTVAQLEDALKALPIIDKLTPEIEGRVNKILGNNPQKRMNFVSWAPFPPIRPIAQ